MSCSSSTICSHLSLPSCSSSSSRSSDSYKDVKTMFIARDINNTRDHHHQRKPPPPIWTVAYSSSPLDQCGSLYFDHATLNRQRNPNFTGGIKSDQPNEDDEESSGVNARKKALFLFIFPVIFIAVFLAVYYVIHLQKDMFLVNSDAVKLGPTVDLGSSNSLNPKEITINNNRNNRDSSIHFSPLNVTKMSDLPKTSEYITDVYNGHEVARKIIEAQFRVSNKMYSRELKNRTSDAFQKLSRLISEKIKLLVSTRKQLQPLQLDKVELTSVRKGDNLLYNLNGIIVDLVLHFNRDVNCSLNEIALNLISAKKDGLLTGLEIDDRTIRLKFSASADNGTKTKDISENTAKEKEGEDEEDHHHQYKWEKWSDWGPTCSGDRGSCDEERVHSRARYCYDKLNQARVDEVYCIKVTRSQHQSLQIEDCVCEKTYKCLEGEWQCLNTQCIPMSKRCDGHQNCFDSSDEENCDCGENEIHCGQNTSCIAIEKKCNNITDCWDNSDEIDCPGYQDYNY